MLSPWALIRGRCVGVGVDVRRVILWSMAIAGMATMLNGCFSG